ncbi:MAG: NAD-dependent epimerase/dehydratase family protein [Pseudomonadota bacterium]
MNAKTLADGPPNAADAHPLPQRALVTGGAGFIGSHIVGTLLKGGSDVVVLDNFSSGYRENLPKHPCLKVIEGDVRDPAALTQSVKGVETVFHLAASVGNKRSIDDPITDSDINVMGTLKLLLAARDHGITKVVASSSAAVYGELQGLPIGEDHRLAPQTPYASSKLAMEHHALAFADLFGIEVVCLRYFNVYGENQRFDPYGNVIPIFARRLVAGEPIIVYGDGEQTRDFVHVDDVVAANLLAARARGVSGVFNVASGSRVTVNTLAQMMLNAAGWPPGAGVTHGPERVGDVRHSLANISAAHTAFQYVPQVALNDGIPRYFGWFSEDTP